MDRVLLNLRARKKFFVQPSHVGRFWGDFATSAWGCKGSRPRVMSGLFAAAASLTTLASSISRSSSSPPSSACHYSSSLWLLLLLAWRWIKQSRSGKPSSPPSSSESFARREPSKIFLTFAHAKSQYASHPGTLSAAKRHPWSIICTFCACMCKLNNPLEEKIVFIHTHTVHVCLHVRARTRTHALPWQHYTSWRMP